MKWFSWRTKISDLSPQTNVDAGPTSEAINATMNPIEPYNRYNFPPRLDLAEVKIKFGEIKIEY